MAFVKEYRIPALSGELYTLSQWGDIGDTWSTVLTMYPLELHNINQSDGWVIEDYFEGNVFKNIRDSIDDDTTITFDNLNWESLSGYTWGRVVDLADDWSTSVLWDKAWQEWEELDLTESLATLDGNWEDRNQTDRGDTVIDNQFLKYTWMSINDTWSSLT